MFWFLQQLDEGALTKKQWLYSSQKKQKKKINKKEACIGIHQEMFSFNNNKSKYEQIQNWY